MAGPTFTFIFMISLGLPLLPENCNGAEILAIIPSAAKSHFIVMEPLFKGLAARGHNITVASSFPQTRPIPNYNDVNISYANPPLTGNITFSLIKEIYRQPVSTMKFFLQLIGQEGYCRRVMNIKEIRELVNSSAKFDLVITQLFADDCFTALSIKFNAPLISIVTTVPFPWVAQRVSNPENPSYIPNYFVPYSDKMTFSERFFNTWLLIISYVYKYYYMDIPSQNVQRKYFGDSVPPLEDIVRNTSVVFLNTHFTTSQVRPYVPNVIEIGGIHIPERQPLPEDLQDLLDSATEGVIVFSLGSLTRTSSFPPEVIQPLLSAFSELPYQMLIKYEDDLPNAPANVHAMKWLPQRDIIEHPNVKLLMTHGGVSSITEAIYAGVPMIGIPLFSDQYANINFLEVKRVGVLLELQTVTKENVLKAIHTVLSDTRYSLNARRLSAAFRDRPLSPLDTAIYWTEYVIRHNGGRHLRSAGSHLTYYQYLALDVATFLTVTPLLIVVTVYYLTKYCCSLLLFRKTCSGKA